MFLLENVLKKRDELAGLAMTLEKKLRNSPKGNLCISKSHKSIQYHLAEEGKPHKKKVSKQKETFNCNFTCTKRLQQKSSCRN